MGLHWWGKYFIKATSPSPLELSMSHPRPLGQTSLCQLETSRTHYVFPGLWFTLFNVILLINLVDKDGSRISEKELGPGYC